MMTLTEKNFEQEVLQATRPVLVDFWAPWCGYCRRIAPALEVLEQEMEAELSFGKVNADEEPEVLGRYQVELLPTLMLFRDGKPLASIVAPGTKAALEEFIRNTLEG